MPTANSKTSDASPALSVDSGSASSSNSAMSTIACSRSVNGYFLFALISRHRPQGSIAHWPYLPTAASSAAAFSAIEAVGPLSRRRALSSVALWTTTYVHARLKTVVRGCGCKQSEFECCLFLNNKKNRRQTIEEASGERVDENASALVVEAECELAALQRSACSVWRCRELKTKKF